MSYDPRQRPQIPQWGQQPMQHGQNPWMQQLAARVHAHQQQQPGQMPMQPPAGGVGVGPGQPGLGGVPQAMPPGPGMQPAPQGQFAANPQLMQALAQRTQQQQAQNQNGPAPSPVPSQATGRVMGMQGMQPDSDKDGN